MREDLIIQMYRQEKYYWWYKAKRYLIRKYIDRIRINKKIAVLDIGCGTGLLIDELKEYGDIWGIDTSDRALNFCRKRGITKIKKATSGKKLPFKNHTFDCVLLLDVLEHIEDEKESLREIKRILKKDGFLIITVPSYQWLYSYWDTILGHKRRYSKGDLVKVVDQSGFKIFKISYLYSFLLPAAVIFRVIKKLLDKNSSSDFVELPPIIHSALFSLSVLEFSLLNITSIPFGLSLFGVFENE